MRKNDRKVKFVAGYDALVKGKILVFFIFVLADTVDDLCQRSVVGLQNSVKFNFFRYSVLVSMASIFASR